MLVTRVLGTLGALALTQLVSATERPLFPRSNITEVSSAAPVETVPAVETGAPEDSFTAYHGGGGGYGHDKGFCERNRDDCRKCVKPIV